MKLIVADDDKYTREGLSNYRFERAKVFKEMADMAPMEYRREKSGYEE